MKLRILTVLAALTSVFVCEGLASAAESKGRVLVIVSSQQELTLRDGTKFPTGYYFNELTVPVKSLVDAGYSVEFADPKGNRPAMDVTSDSAEYFGGDQAKHEVYRHFHDSLAGLKKPRRLNDVVRSGLDGYRAVFFPGGHAPMQDLLKDKDVRAVLEHFHARGKITALICHGPISLLAAMPNAELFTQLLAKGQLQEARRLARGWPYAGYKMTVFSKPEEQVAEDKKLGGKVLFYPNAALMAAGGNVVIGEAWQSHAVRDRELITGQNPFSDEKFTELLLKALSEKSGGSS